MELQQAIALVKTSGYRMKAPLACRMRNRGIRRRLHCLRAGLRAGPDMGVTPRSQHYARAYA